MDPVAFYIGSFPVMSYGVLAALGVAVGILVVLREGRRLGWDSDALLDLSLYLVLAGVIGSRLLYAAIEWEQFAARPLDLLKIWEGGLSWFGALAAGLAVAVWWTRRRGIHLGALGDLLALGVAAGYPFGRIGCFLNGCCYGHPTDLPWAVAFPFDGVPRHPTQLYSFGIGLLIFAVLWGWRRRKPFDGYLMWLYLLLYAAYRFVMDFWRETPPGPDGLTVGQAGSLAVMAVALGFLWRGWRQRPFGAGRR